jgi:teichuronic acid biosynthesis glycosyltransferase TuaG
MISVIMPAYNAERTIKEAIESVLNQTYHDFELIVINDASLDNTLKIVEEYMELDQRVKLIDNPKNSGVSVSRNKGVSMARGEYIAFLDSDDIWRHDKLEKQLKLMKEKVAVLSYTASSFIDQKGTVFNYIMQAEEKLSLDTLLKKNLISCSSAMVRADVMKRIKMPNDKMHEDYYVWITILKEYKYAYGVNEPLLIYRLSTNSKSSNRLKSAKMIFNTYKAVGYKVSACFLTLRYTIHSVQKRMKIKHT